MITSALEFHVTLAVVAALVSFLFGGFDELDDVRILRTVALTVSEAVAHGAGFGSTFFAFSELVVDKFWWDPFAASC